MGEERVGFSVLTIIGRGIGGGYRAQKPLTLNNSSLKLGWIIAYIYKYSCMYTAKDHLAL